MKKNIQSQLEEMKEMIENMDIRISELENPDNDSTFSDDCEDSEETTYKFTQEQLEDFLVGYTERIKESIMDKISDMDMDDEDLWSVETEGNTITVEISADKVSDYIDSELVGMDTDDMVSLAHEVMDDNGIDYTIH